MRLNKQYSGWFFLEYWSSTRWWIWKFDWEKSVEKSTWCKKSFLHNWIPNFKCNFKTSRFWKCHHNSHEKSNQSELQWEAGSIYSASEASIVFLYSIGSLYGCLSVTFTSPHWVLMVERKKLVNWIEEFFAKNLADQIFEFLSRSQAIKFCIFIPDFCC